MHENRRKRYVQDSQPLPQIKAITSWLTSAAPQLWIQLNILFRVVSGISSLNTISPHRGKLKSQPQCLGIVTFAYIATIVLYGRLTVSPTYTVHMYRSRWCTLQTVTSLTPWRRAACSGGKDLVAQAVHR